MRLSLPGCLSCCQADLCLGELHRPSSSKRPRVCGGCGSLQGTGGGLSNPCTNHPKTIALMLGYPGEAILGFSWVYLEYQNSAHRRKIRHNAFFLYVGKQVKLNSKALVSLLASLVHALLQAVDYCEACRLQHSE